MLQIQSCMVLIINDMKKSTLNWVLSIDGIGLCGRVNNLIVCQGMFEKNTKCYRSANATDFFASAQKNCFMQLVSFK